MFIDLFLASVGLLVGTALFGHFESYTSPLRKLAKFAAYLGIVALLSSAVGHWSIVAILGLLAFGVGVHFWWCLAHQINPLTAEPRDRYFALRGWKVS